MLDLEWSKRLALGLACWAGLGAGQAAAQRRVWVVDDDGPADFANIQPAVDAAAEGDVLLVRDGSYTSFTIDGRSLTVHGDAGGAVRLTHAQAHIFVRNLAPSQAVMIRGIDVQGQGFGFGFPQAGLRLEQNQGPVWVEDCVIEGTDGGVVSIGFGGAQVVGCASVLFSRCTLRGSAADEFSQGLNHGLNHGLFVLDSSVSLYDCVVEAGPSQPAPPSPGACPAGFCGDLSPSCSSTDGGHGVELLGASVLFASGSVLRGADGGPGQDQPPDPLLSCTPGGRGGDGLRILGGEVRLLDTSVVAGVGQAGGQWSFCPGQCPSGSDGAVFSNPAAVTVLPGGSRFFSISSPAREGGSVQIDALGLAGDTVFLSLSTAQGPGAFIPKFSGTYHVGSPLPPL